MFSDFGITQGLLVDTAALAAVALVGYLFGRRTRQVEAAPDAKLAESLGRAQTIAKELEHISQRVRTETTAHQQSITAFQSQIRLMQIRRTPADWPTLGERADALITPTMKLATNLSLAYDQLRAQQAQLTTFSGSRIDRETGLHNRRSVEEHLAALLSTHADGRRRFGVALFSVTSASNSSETYAADILKPVARLLEDCVRGNDFMARYSHDEFLVLMPKTALSGALVFAERLVRLAESDLGLPLWGGVVEAACGETAEKLLSRADSALYSARTHETASLFYHTGSAVRRHALEIETSGSTAAGGPTAESACSHS